MESFIITVSRRVAVIALALVILASNRTSSVSASAPSLSPTLTGRLIISAERAGAWNLFIADPNGGAALLPFAARDPAVSPDGKTVAFRSHRDGFWDIYTAPVAGGSATRLTRNMIYSGAPVWSPDGRKIAFESYARGDLDIWVMNADGMQASDLTNEEKTYDSDPTWSPDGKWIAFTSWRTGTQQIFVVTADCSSGCKAINFSQNKDDDQQPAFSPDGKKLAFVSDRTGQRAIYTADFSSTGLKNVKRVTFSGWDDQPVWSPDGQWIAFVSARPKRQPVYIVSADGGIPRELDGGPDWAVSVDWSPDSSVPVNSAGDSPEPLLFLAKPDLAAGNSGHPYEMRRMTTAKLDPGINKLNGRVADSFIALQGRLKQEVGYDFLAVLADMVRPIDLKCDVTCDTLSWHKAGRAFDSRLDYTDARGSALEIVREDQQGETFWREFLRTSAQDGSMGEPMKEAPWDMSYRARWVVAPGEGGVKKAVPYGFYLDLTELAREYGWERISSHNEEDFDWKSDKTAAEYWHYQQQQGLNWYQAMREVYTESDLGAIVDWDALIKSGYEPYLLYLKGIPAPAKSWRWYALSP